MISRRNIRVKVMQTLYALEAIATDDKSDAQKEKGRKLLNTKIKNASESFAFAMLYVARVAQYAEKDARIRASKYLPSQEDLSVNTKIAGNTLLWVLLENTTFTERVATDKLEGKLDQDLIKKTYQRLVQTEAYKAYTAIETRNDAKEKAILQHIWKEEILGNETFQEYLSDTLDDWEDDKEMIEMLVYNFFNRPKGVNFLQFISAEKQEFAQSLLSTTLEKQEGLMTLISPKLKNWDAERIAVIDMILLKMGISELLYFPTIPVKVTINEYIEIAKQYSTEQSGQFVNGVLDNVLKELAQANKIRKVERK